MSCAPATIRIALLGCGTVGRRVAELILRDADSIAARTGIRLELARILVRDVQRERGFPRALFTERFEDIVADEDVQLVIEVLGGLEPARACVSRLLARGVHVVTVNKTLIAHHGPELRAIAQRSGAALAYEASVCTAVPILAALRGLAGDRVRSIRGIVSGACNFILCTIAREGCSLDAAVDRARERGLVEPDPAADLSGRDAAEKLCILADALGRRIAPNEVDTRGIETITSDDIAAARRAGYAIKLLAELDDHGARVGPVLLPARHPLAAITGEDNAVEIQSDLAGELFFRGKGAGPDPTGSTILGDLLGILSPLAPGSTGGTIAENSPSHGDLTHRPAPRETREVPWFVRVPTGPQRLRPERVLNALRNHGVDVQDIQWRTRSAALWTKPARERSIAAGVEELLGDCRDAALLARCAPYLGTVAVSPPGGAGG